MSVLAVRSLGVLHGAAGLVVLLMAASLPDRPEAKSFPKAKLHFLVGKLALSGLTLIACAIAALVHPQVAWIPAALSLLSYAPGPTWAKLCISTGHYKVASTGAVIQSATNLRRKSIIGLTVRAAFVVLLAVAGNH